MTTNRDIAYGVAVDAAEHGLLDAKGVNAPRRRRRSKWARQIAYDEAYLMTVSTRLPKHEAQLLMQCCREANITRHALLRYMLQTWCAAWQTSGVAIHGKQ